MSRENVEIVREVNSAFERGDLSGALAAADPELVTYRATPDGRTFHGREGFLDAMSDWVENFAEYGFTAEDYRDAGDRVLVRFRQWGRGEASAVDVEGYFWVVYTLADGRITRLDIFNAEDRAREAAGLRE
jgi:ketosteroid isomerase-like protein